MPDSLRAMVLFLGGTAAFVGARHTTEVGAPALVTTLAGAAAAVSLAYWLYHPDDARRERTAKGLCPRCGYDLRATPGRCPECGATAN